MRREGTAKLAGKCSCVYHLEGRDRVGSIRVALVKLTGVDD